MCDLTSVWVESLKIRNAQFQCTPVMYATNRNAFTAKSILDFVSLVSFPSNY